MANVDLTKYGITGTTEIVHNPSYETLFEEETKAGLEGYEVGTVIHHKCKLRNSQHNLMRSQSDSTQPTDHDRT